MKCFEETIYSMFLDGELDNKKSQRIKEHLKKCQSCCKIVENLRYENNRIKSVFEGESSFPDMSPEIMNKILYPKPSILRKGKFIPALIYGFLVFIGILTPFILYSQMMSSHIFSQLVSILFNHFNAFHSIGRFLVKNIAFISSEQLIQSIVIQIFISIILISFLRKTLLEHKKIKGE